MGYARPAMIPRLFTPLELSQGVLLELDGAASHHAIRVLRLGIGATIELFDGRGGAASAIIASTSPATVRVERLHARTAAPALHLTLAQCISAAEKMDWTIEKAVELGVAAIVPLQSHKAIVKLSAERAAKRHEHWQRLILAASAQSGQNRAPDLQPAMKLEDWLRRAHREPDVQPGPLAGTAPLRLVLDPQAGRSLPAVMTAQEAAGASQRAVVLLCGPEAGFSEAELQQARAAGWVPAALGPRVLRTETAGLAALAVLQARWGDLR
jgi:16S rRNA (uracil1498-N3)-methyltransferase